MNTKPITSSTELLPKFREVQTRLPKPLALKIFLYLAEDHSLKDVVSFGSTCKRFYLISKNPKIWEIFFQKVPRLDDYSSCEDKYAILKDYYEAKRNVRNGKYSSFYINNPLMDPYAIYTNNNILRITLEDRKSYICNMFQTPCFEIEKKYLETSNHFKRFVIYQNELGLQVWDLASNKQIQIEVAQKIVKGTHKFHNTTLKISSLLLPKGLKQKSIVTFSCNQESKKIDMHIWNLETGKQEKTLENVIDASKTQRVSIVGKSLPTLVFSQSDEGKVNVITYDIDKDRHYEYSVTKSVFENHFDLIDRFIGINYLVFYSSIDEIITFVHRETGKKSYIDLGSKELNITAVTSLLNTQKLCDYMYAGLWRGLVFPGRGDGFIINEEKDLFLFLSSKGITSFDLEKGTSTSLKQDLTVVGVHDDLLNLLSPCQKKYIFLDAKTLKIVCEKECDLAAIFYSKSKFVIFPNATERLKKIYITELREEVTLQLNPSSGYLSDRSALWESFLAMVYQTNFAKGVTIFDIKTGDRLLEVPVAELGKTLSLQWLNGCLLIQIQETKEVIIMNFNTNSSFPKEAEIDKKKRSHPTQGEHPTKFSRL